MRRLDARRSDAPCRIFVWMVERGQDASDQPKAVRNIRVSLSQIYRHGQLRCVTLHVPRTFSSPTIWMIWNSNHGHFLAPELVYPSSRSAETNFVGIQPSTQATETQLPWTKNFANMDPHSAPGFLDERHELRFCSSPSIRLLGCAATPTNAQWDPFLESGNFAPRLRRQLSGNTNLKHSKTRGQPVSTTAGHPRTRSIERLSLLCAWPRIVLDLLWFSSGAQGWE